MNPIYYREGYKYQLARAYRTTTTLRPAKPIHTLYVDLECNGELTAGAGYAWNGPSGPTIDTRNSIRGSMEHDVKYQLIRLGLLDRSTKPIADREFREVLIADGMNRVRAWYWWWGVARFGNKSTLPSSEPPILIAP